MAVVAASLAIIISASASAAELRAKVVVTRHGIRTPFFSFDGHSASDFSRGDSRNWFMELEAWGAAAPEFLTDHGKLLVQELGAIHRKNMPRQRLENMSFTCYSDSQQRTLATAESYFRGLAPEVSFKQHTANSQYLFNQGQTISSNPACGVPPTIEITGSLGGSPTKIASSLEPLLQKLNREIGCCKESVCRDVQSASAAVEGWREGGGVEELSEGESPHDKKTQCSLLRMPSHWADASSFFSVMNGPLSAAASISEYLLLLYVNGMNVSEVAPHISPEDALLMTGALSEFYNGIVFKNYATVRHFGSTLLAHLLATMQQVTERALNAIELGPILPAVSNVSRSPYAFLSLFGLLCCMWCCCSCWRVGTTPFCDHQSPTPWCFILHTTSICTSCR
jgi:hypothetical protein